MLFSQAAVDNKVIKHWIKVLDNLFIFRIRIDRIRPARLTTFQVEGFLM